MVQSEVNNNLYNSLITYGQKFPTNLYMNPQEVMKDLEDFSEEWKPYNPRKKIAREGLSVTSLDGGLSGIPDLDSIREYCIKNQVILGEHSFNQETPVANIVRTYLDPFKGHVGRSHFIRMGKGGHFPPHRDDRRASVNNMRLFVPIKDCNPPKTFFMLDREPLYFDHGRAYFINTCMEHTLFSCYPSLFLVMNVAVNEETVKTLLNNMQWR